MTDEQKSLESPLTADVQEAPAEATCAECGGGRLAPCYERDHGPGIHSIHDSQGRGHHPYDPDSDPEVECDNCEETYLASEMREWRPPLSEQADEIVRICAHCHGYALGYREAAAVRGEAETPNERMEREGAAALERLDGYMAMRARALAAEARVADLEATVARWRDNCHEQEDLREDERVGAEEARARVVGVLSELNKRVDEASIHEDQVLKRAYTDAAELLERALLAAPDAPLEARNAAQEALDALVADIDKDAQDYRKNGVAADAESIYAARLLDDHGLRAAPVEAAPEEKN